MTAPETPALDVGDAAPNASQSAATNIQFGDFGLHVPANVNHVRGILVISPDGELSSACRRPQHRPTAHAVSARAPDRRSLITLAAILPTALRRRRPWSGLQCAACGSSLDRRPSLSSAGTRMTDTILIVDDDPGIRASLSEALRRDGHAVEVAANAEAALNGLAAAAPSVVLTDVRMPGMDGLELLNLLRSRSPDVAVVLMSAFEDLPTVAAAMRDGAADFLVKPLDLHQVRATLVGVLSDRAQRQRRLVTAPLPERAPSELVGRSSAMIEVFKRIGRAAATRATVLVRGESGTGKELVARSIHSAGATAAEPFVPVNCAALPETLLESELFGHVRGAFTGASADRPGRFAAAGNGTIFLDEIGDTTPGFQSRLLRVLQAGEYFPVGSDRAARTAARVIAATHRDLEEAVTSGEFRQDLYYRLRVMEIRLPPLRERSDDIPLLAEHLVGKASRAAERAAPVLSDEALLALLTHDWPGNVRELENCLARAVLFATGDVIRREHLSFDAPAAAGGATPASLVDAERQHIAHVLRVTGGHKSRAAEILGISRPRLDRLIRRYGLEQRAVRRRRAD
jgi:DNA-binding NtrC family response regulator